MSDENVLERDEPPTYAALASDWVVAHESALWGVAGAVFVIGAILNDVAITHVAVVEIPPLLAVEADAGESLAENIYLPGAIASLVIQALAGAASVSVAVSGGFAE